MRAKTRILALLGLALAGWTIVAAQVNQAWVVRHRGPAGDDSVARALVLDANTNVIVTGGSDGEYATVKYDRNGNQIWEARYRGPEEGYNFARGMVLDNAGNIYVTGSSFGAGGNLDYATIKYDAAGNLLWAARYDGPAHTNDASRAIAVDRSGNVYVTGSSDYSDLAFGDTENGYFATIKYDAKGNQLWVARYAGEDDVGFRDSQAYALAVDDSGNVYVTGYSTGSGSDYDFTTVKYDSNGNQTWLARYDGPVHGIDQNYSLALDDAGNVCITGGSKGDTSYDYATVKYGTNGNQLWVARYNGPADGIDEANAIAVDSAGNLYVTGTSTGTNTGYDIVTIKYERNGNELWVARDGGSRSDKAFAIALDNAANVFVTGYGDAGFSFGGFNYETIKYGANGNRIWAITYAGPGCAEFGSDLDNSWAVAVDGAGDIYVTGESGGCFSGRTYATVKYTEDSVGSLPPTIVDQPQSLTVLGGSDAEFEIYASGTAPLSYQWLFNGTPLASATNSYLAFTNVQAEDAGDYRAVVWNAFGSATSVVAHLTVQAAPPTITFQPQSQAVLEGDSVTLSVAATGSAPLTHQWRFNGTNLSYATNTALILTNVQTSNTGDYRAVVSNQFGAATSFVARLTVQFRVSPGVGQAWAARLTNSTGPGFAKVDTRGDVYVVGSLAGDYAAAKYDGSGSQLWVARYNRSGNNVDTVLAMGMDSVGNVYLTGMSHGGTNTDYDYATVKLDSNGNQRWVARYNGPANGFDVAYAVAVDGANNSYVTGWSSGDYATIKYDVNGTQAWVSRHNVGPFALLDSDASIAVDTAGNVYVAGSSDGANGSRDFATTKFEPNGNLLWLVNYDGALHLDDSAHALVVDSRGNVYVAGESYNGISYDYVIVKYDPNGTELWVARYNNALDHSGARLTIALEEVGNLVVGAVNVTMKYASDGRQLWLVRHTNFYAAAMVLDNFGNTYRAGSTSGGSGADYSTVKFDPNGNQLWVARYNGSANHDDTATSLALDNAGNVYVTGYSCHEFCGGYDLVTVKYVQAPAAPRLISPALLLSGQFQFTLVGEAGRSYTIQASTNLANWTVLTNFVSTTGTNQFSYLTAPSLNRTFYRAVSP